MKKIHVGDPVSKLTQTPPSAEFFDYEKALASNRGWVSQSEQALLKDKRVAIGGVGGVGGDILLTLARCGITKFKIADMDGLGQAGIDTLAKRVQGINSGCELDLFKEGMRWGHVVSFMKDVDLYVDALDLFPC